MNHNEYTLLIENVFGSEPGRDILNEWEKKYNSRSSYDRKDALSMAWNDGTRQILLEIKEILNQDNRELPF